MNSPDFPLHDETTAPQASKTALRETRERFTMIPNLERVMAAAPSLLRGYSTLWDLFDETTLTPIERQIVYLTANFANECNYCVPWHTMLARRAGMPQPVIDALRAGARLPDERYEALRAFTRALIVNHGKIVEAELRAFLDAGYVESQALEVILGLAVKLMSNYTNSIAGTPLEDGLKKFAWRKPIIEMRK